MAGSAAPTGKTNFDWWMTNVPRSGGLVTVPTLSHIFTAAPDRAPTQEAEMPPEQAEEEEVEATADSTDEAPAADDTEAQDEEINPLTHISAFIVNYNRSGKGFIMLNGEQLICTKALSIKDLGELQKAIAEDFKGKSSSISITLPS